MGRPPRGRSGGPPSSAARRAWRARVDREAAAGIVQGELDARVPPSARRLAGERPADAAAAGGQRVGIVEGWELRRARQRDANSGAWKGLLFVVVLLIGSGRRRLDRGPAGHRPGGHRPLRAEPRHPPHAHRRGPPARGTGRPSGQAGQQRGDGGQVRHRPRPDGRRDPGESRGCGAAHGPPGLQVPHRVRPRRPAPRGGHLHHGHRDEPAGRGHPLGRGPRPADAGRQPGTPSRPAHRADRGVPAGADGGDGALQLDPKEFLDLATDPAPELLRRVPLPAPGPGGQQPGGLPGRGRLRRAHRHQRRRVPAPAAPGVGGGLGRPRWHRRARRASTSTMP